MLNPNQILLLERRRRDAPVNANLAVFLGQSNSEGWSTDPQNTTALTNGHGYAYFEPNDVSPLGIVLPGRKTGGPQSAWCQAWCSGGGGPVITVNCSVGGSSMIAAAAGAGGTWDLASGSNHWQTTMRQRVLNALSAAAANGFQITAIDFYWAQGEQDAGAYNGTTISASIYRTKFAQLINLVASDTPGFRKFFVSLVGYNAGNPSEDPDYDLIRGAQVDGVADVGSKAFVAFADAYTFVARGLMVDNQHYTQAGYNEMGTNGATAALVAIGSPSQSLPNTDKYYAQAAIIPDRTGFKKMIIRTTRVGSLALQSYFGSSVNGATNHWKDCAGENLAKASNMNVAPTWSYAASGEKTIVFYTSSAETDVSVVGGGNAGIVELTADDGIGIGTINLGTSGDSTALTRARVTFSAFTNVTYFGVSTNALGMTDADIAALPNITTLIISTGPPALTRGKTVLPAITNFRYANMTSAVAASVVNAILADCVAAGNNNGTLQLQGTNMAAPTGQGITDKTTLQSRGWTVTTQ